MDNIQNLLGKFETGNTVTINIYEIETGTLIIDNENCIEIGSTGLFKYKPDITVIEYTEYVWMMQNQLAEQITGVFSLDLSLEEITTLLNLIINNGSGNTEKTYTLETQAGIPIANAYIRVTSDLEGLYTIANAITNQNGQVTLQLNDGETVYIWRSKTGLVFINPDIETV